MRQGARRVELRGKSGDPLPPMETLGGFDPPIQHHPYGHSTANRVPAVGRNKIDPVNVDPPLPPATDGSLRADSHVGESSKTLLAGDAFVQRSGRR